MRHLFFCLTIVFSLYSFAESTEDLSQMLKDSHCIPVRDSTGSVTTIRCDGPLGDKMKQGEVVNSPAQTMELYNKATDKVAVRRPAPLTEKIKSCLAGVYISQISFHKAKGTYTSAGEEFGLNRISMCKGLDVSAYYADQRGFKFIAKTGDSAWSVDETKTMEEIR